MTFTQIQTRILNYCNLSSTDASTRVGISINNHYRRITSLLGLSTLRHTTVSQSMTIGVRTLTFAGLEKIDRIIDVTTASAPRLLDERSLHDLRSMAPGSDAPNAWALQNANTDSITVLFDNTPDAAYDLQADGATSLSDLSGSNEPDFPESFHDILTWFVIAEELLKKEKDRLAAVYEAKAEKLLSDLRFHLADSPLLSVQQANEAASTPASSGGGGGTSMFLQAGTGASERSVQSKLREWVSVTDFGAVGDGTTDDTTAIQAAITEVQNGHGGAVYFPCLGASTTYKTTAALLVTKACALIAAPKVYISATGLSPGDAVLHIDGTVNPNLEEVYVEGMTLMSNNDSPDLLKLERVAYGVFRNIGLRGGRYGLVITGDRTFSNLFDRIVTVNTAQSSASVRFEDCDGGQHTFVGCSLTGGIGVSIVDGSATTSALNGVVFTGCNFESCTTNGVAVDCTSLEGLNFLGCRFEKNQGSGGVSLLVNPDAAKTCHGISVIGCYFETDTEAFAIQFGGAGGEVRGFTIMGNYAKDYSTCFVRLNGEGYSGLIVGNRLQAVAAVINAASTGVTVFGNGDASGTMAVSFPEAWSFTGLANTGLKVLDTNASHALAIVPGSDLTDARTLTLATGDADRTVTLSGNPTLADWFDQAVKSTSSPTFAAPTITTSLTLTGGKITFPATQSASGDANTLDDYEEGTWTPTDASGATLSLTTDSSAYVKVGKLVIATFRIVYPATADGSNTLIGGLPFTVAASSNSVIGGSIAFASEATATTLLVTQNATTFAIRTLGGAVTNATMSTDEIRGSITYIAAA